MKLMMIFWALAIGLMVPLQAIINAKLSSQIGGPTQAALISFGGGFLIFVIVAIFNFNNLPSVGKVMSVPPYLLTGGIIGAVFVLSAIIIVPKLGSTGWVALIVTGQLVASLILDHYGWLGLSSKAINVYRVIGSVLLLTGSALIIRF
jgi:transporter family-2 protein